VSGSPSEAAGGVLIGAMWSWAGLVLEPARALRRRTPPPELAPGPRPGLGPRFSVGGPAPRLLDTPTDHDGLVAEFDRLSEVYDAYVRPFSTPIFAEALALLAPLLPADARVLDAGCGPGREVKAVARRVPAGEVVGVDLAAGMVVSAHRAARAAGLDNTAFVQADVSALPADFAGSFDVVYSCLAHHHYPEPAQAAAGVLRSLRPGGTYAVVDAGPAWSNRLAAPLARVADPGWVGFHDPDQFRALLSAAGFVEVEWHGLLPGFGVALGRAPSRSEARADKPRTWIGEERSSRA
jgi:SAM-dependent methyltransferase